MTHLRKSALLSLCIAMLAPTAAFAHPAHDVGSLMAGLVHPLSGLDHVLMIIAVSAWAGGLPAAGRVMVAACLAVFVGAGALLPVAGGAALEAGIALTVVGAGMLLALGRRWPTWATGMLAAVFALIHGFAHGAEGPGRSLFYVAGLVCATGGLALASAFIAARLGQQNLLLRAAGGVGAAAGTWALI